MSSNPGFSFLDLVEKTFHPFREALEKGMRLEGPRTHLAEVLGWERALRLRYPDWFRALPEGEIATEDFQGRLKELIHQNPGIRRTVLASLSVLIHQAASPCEHHTNAQAQQHHAEQKRAQKILEVLNSCLKTESSPLLTGGTFGLGNLNISKKTAEEKALEILKEEATRSTDIRWHYTTARQAMGETTALNHPKVALVTAATLAAVGVWTLGGQIKEAFRPLEPKETVVTRVVEQSPVGALYAGAYILGALVSREQERKDKKHSPTEQQRKEEATLLMGHIVVGEGGLYAASALEAVSGTLRGGFDVKQWVSSFLGPIPALMSDVISDFAMTPFSVAIFEKAQKGVMKGKPFGRHVVNSLGAMLSTAALHGAVDAVKGPVIVVYAAVHGLSWGVMNLYRAAKEHPDFLRRTVIKTAGGCSLAMMVTGWASPAMTPNQVPSTPEKLVPAVVTEKKTVDYRIPQGGTLSSADYRIPQGGTLSSALRSVVTKQTGKIPSETGVANTVESLKKQGISVNQVQPEERVFVKGKALD